MFFFNSSVEAGNGHVVIPVPDYYREKMFFQVKEGGGMSASTSLIETPLFPAAVRGDSARPVASYLARLANTSWISS